MPNGQIGVGSTLKTLRSKKGLGINLLLLDIVMAQARQATEGDVYF